MASRFQCVLLKGSRLNALCASLLLTSMLVMPLQASAEGKLKNWLRDVKVLAKAPERREVRLSGIDTEDFEIGAYVGMQSIEDFGSNRSEGVRVTYHATEDLFLEAFYGQSELGLTSFEQLSGGVMLLTDDERQLRHYGVLVGWNFLPGESFLAERWRVASGLYLIGGAGVMKYAGDDTLALTVGMGYRILANDWLALRLEVRDHLVESDLFGEEKVTHNMEVLSGLTVFF